MPDVQFDNHGTIWLVTPLTDAARQWVDQNVALESWQRFGGGFVVEPRYVEPLTAGMLAAGLEVN